MQGSRIQVIFRTRYIRFSITIPQIPATLRIPVSIEMALIKTAVHTEEDGIRASAFCAVYGISEDKLATFHALARHVRYQRLRLWPMGCSLTPDR
jgi:hypothetical protein